MENKDNSADKNMKKTDSANLQLTKIMEQILQMLQKNSIHMDLSDEDIARLERQEQSILDSLEQIRIQADENRNRVHRIFDEKKVLCDQLNANLSALYVHMEILKQINHEQESIYEGRKNLYDAYNASYISKQEAYSKAQEKLESARRKAEKQNELLKRWFWVPGYGAYLAFDKLLNDQEADTDAAYREYCASKERLAAISRDLESTLAVRVLRRKHPVTMSLFLIRHSDMVSMNTMAHLLRYQHMWQSVTASCSQNLRTPVSIKACKRLPEPLWTIQIQSLIITRRKQTKMRSCFIFHIQIFNRGICSLRYR